MGEKECSSLDTFCCIEVMLLHNYAYPSQQADKSSSLQIAVLIYNDLTISTTLLIESSDMSFLVVCKSLLKATTVKNSSRV
jgi:hypothetical protein